MAQEHYVCGGKCGGISMDPGVCMTEGCDKQQQPLDACDCEDLSSHDGMSGMPEKQPEGPEE